MAKGDKEDLTRAKAKAKAKTLRAMNDYYYLGIPPKNKSNRKVTKTIKLEVKQGVKNAVKNNEITLSKKSPISARKPSVASKANAKNKMKAQGAKAMSSPTSGYGKSTRPRGK